MILSQLEPDDLLTCNQLGNIQVRRSGQYIGFIDFTDECWDPADGSTGDTTT